MGGYHHGALEVMAEQVTGRGARGVVAAGAPLAAAIGAQALRGGGNAFDAVVAAALSESVLLPPKCGLGGDVVALRVPPEGGRPEALLAIGGAPGALARAVRARGLPETGGLSVGPPGAIPGYAALAREATRPLADLAAPAASLARDGFVWSSICAWLTEQSRGLLAAHQPSGCAYLPRSGRPAAAGQVVRLPGLAAAIEELAARGQQALDGPLGEAIVRRVASAGGVLARDDLRGVRADWVPADEHRITGWDLWVTPAPTHGPVLADVMSTVASAGDTGPDPVALWRAFAQATARRRARLADPAPSGTSMVSAADEAGNVVAVIHSNSYPTYGSGLVVPEYDLILNNRAGRGFVDTETHPNFPEPGRRPATTLHAWAMGPRDHGRPVFVGATPGGANQVSWNAQTIAQVLAGERRPGVLVASPRWEWRPSDDSVAVEEGFSEAVLHRLRDTAPGGAEAVARWALRCAQQVLAVPEPGSARVAAADPRTVGAVVTV